MAAFVRTMWHADVILAIDDVSIDLVNVDQVNGSIGVHGQGSAGPTSRSLMVTDRQGPHVGLKEMGHGPLGSLSSLSLFD